MLDLLIFNRINIIIPLLGRHSPRSLELIRFDQNIFHKFGSNLWLLEWLICPYRIILEGGERCELLTQPRKIQFLRTFGVGPFFFFFGSNQRERYFSMEHGRWKVARRSLHQLPQPPPETFDDDNPQPPKINWSP